MKKNLLITIFVFLSVNAHALDIPNKFTNGEATDADKVNENFQTLGTAIDNVDKKIIPFGVNYRTFTDKSGVGLVLCDANEGIIAGGCYCTGQNSKGTNYGVLFSCTQAGNGWGGACYNESYSWDPKLSNSPVEIIISCVTNVVYSASKAKIESDNKKAQESLDKLREMVKERDLALRNKQ